MKCIDLTRTVEDMTRLLRASLPKKIVFEKKLANDLPLIEADDSQIQQIVMNLLINAAEAIGQDNVGTVVLETGVGTFSAELLGRSRVPHELSAGGYVFLSVRDSGCGMSPETLEKIFEPFYSTKRTGRGLGLSAVLGIVRGHKGAIIVESEQGAGTTFQLLFPSCKGSPSPLAESPVPSEAFNGSATGTVLVADDEDGVLIPAYRMLQKMGYHVLVARNGAEAVSLFQCNIREVTCVILDLTMPVLGGIEVCDRILALRPDVPVILSSGYSEEDLALGLGERAMTGFIQKPYTLADLKALVVSATS